MSALGVATTVAFGGLALVALAQGLMARRSSMAVLAVGLAGLLAVTASATWLVRSRLQAPSAAIASDVPKPADATEKPRREPDEQGRSGQPDARPGLEKACDEARAEARAATEKVTELERQLEEARALIEKFRTAPAPPAPDPAPPPPVPTPQAPAPTAEASAPREPRSWAVPLRGLLGKRLATPFYSIEPLGAAKLMAGRSGEWHLIRLRPDDRPLIFPDRKFRLPEVQLALAASIGHLIEDIIKPVASGSRSRALFVRGGADARPIAGIPDTPEADALSIRVRQMDGTYGAAPTTLRLRGMVQNVDLPSLRADWLRRELERFSRAEPLGEIGILDDPPAPDRERTAEILLYVEW